MPRYSSEPRSRGAYLTGMGVVWTLLQLAIVLAAGKPVVPDDQTLAFGLAAGLLEASANLALIERLTHTDVGLASPIYRLNIIAVVAWRCCWWANSSRSSRPSASCWVWPQWWPSMYRIPLRGGSSWRCRSSG